MEYQIIRVPVAEIRETLLELCTYIPYFEERVGGTFKFQYPDEQTDELKDYEGYEESNRHASFPDPLFDDWFKKFKRNMIQNVTSKFSGSDLFSRFRDTELCDWKLPADKLGWLLDMLSYTVIHERMCTGFTAMCMKSGTYLQLLKHIEAVLAEVPEDTVIVCSRRKWQESPTSGTGNCGGESEMM